MGHCAVAGDERAGEDIGFDRGVIVDADRRAPIPPFRIALQQAFDDRVAKAARALLTEFEAMGSYDFNPADLGTVQEAVDWSEPFISVLLGIHVFIFLWIFITRGFINVLIGNFFGLEPLNFLASQNYKSFSSTNYFDEHGVFAGIMYAGPLLFNMFLVVIFLLAHASSLLVRVKRAQIKQKLQKKSATEEKKKDK
ncbi:Transmembrane protein 18 [Quaeritorhiza haematococci]|nr:Transmembrane protein 18 [Quaeritorhiza haematococci]